MTRLFGTDGMRGVALEPPLDRGTVTRLGRSLADHLTAAGRPGRILLAGDTRESTEVLAGWLGGSFIASGGELHWAGVLPTPSVSHLLRDDGGFGAGVVISASHNPAQDNGIKLVAPTGTKWSVAEERALEARLAHTPPPARIAKLPAREDSWRARVARLLAATLPAGALAGMRVVVDAANGAGVALAEEVFGSLGAAVELINADPDGRNINLDCGALHPEAVARVVLAQRADAGVALDGDADRAILVAPSGRVLDGDDVLLAWGRALAEEGRLPGNVIVATVMSNLGLEVALSDAGLRLVRCPVGDRAVWDAMQREGAALGGEQSGHVICSHFAASGDGLLTATHVLSEARKRSTSLDEIATLVRFPQVLLNVRVGARRPVADVPELARAIAAAESRLAGAGRVFVRYSGTEPLLRIMVEARESSVARQTAQTLAEVAGAALR
jgi:phosphoglucosamine mutase